MGGTTAIIGGLLLAIICGLSWVLSAATTNACQNALVDALDAQGCATVTAIHDGSGLLLLAGLALAGWGIWLVKRS